MNEGLWLYEIYYDKDREDIGFKLVEPILAAIFYPFIALPTIGAIKCDYRKALLYYDKDERIKYCQELKKQAEEAASDALTEEASAW